MVFSKLLEFQGGCFGTRWHSLEALQPWTSCPSQSIAGSKLFAAASHSTFFNCFPLRVLSTTAYLTPITNETERPNTRYPDDKVVRGHYESTTDIARRDSLLLQDVTTEYASADSHYPLRPMLLSQGTSPRFTVPANLSGPMIIISYLSLVFGSKIILILIADILELRLKAKATLSISRLVCTRIHSWGCYDTACSCTHLFQAAKSSDVFPVSSFFFAPILPLFTDQSCIMVNSLFCFFLLSFPISDICIVPMNSPIYVLQDAKKFQMVC